MVFTPCQGTIEGMRRDALAILAAARRSEDVLADLDKFLLSEQKMVTDSPCMISTEYRGDFSLIDVIDHLLVTAENDKKQYSAQLVILSGLLSIGLVNGFVMAQEANYGRKTVAELNLSKYSGTVDEKLQSALKATKPSLLKFAEAVVEQWAADLNPRPLGKNRVMEE